MLNFNRHFFVLVFLGIILAAIRCGAGNQELMERRIADLRSINEQVVAQAVPDGLKEGETVEIKATLRVERTPETAPVVHGLQVARVMVSGGSRTVPVKTVIPAAGFGKHAAYGMTAQQSVEGALGLRQESSRVPSGNNKE